MCVSRNRAGAAGVFFFALWTTQALASGTPGWRMSAGAGPRFSLGEMERSRLGTPFAPTLGLAAAVSTNDVWFFLETGYVRATGDLVSQDPTFDAEDAVCRMIPITFGFRRNTVPAAQRQATSIYAGLGWMVAPVRLETPYRPKVRTTIYGITFELRPEVDVAADWRVWFSGQLALLSEATFEDLDERPDLHLSATTLGLGISRSFGPEGRQP